MRAQSALELLLVLAGMLAAWAFMLPAVTHASEKAKNTTNDLTQKQALNEIEHAWKEVLLMPTGSFKTVNARLTKAAIIDGKNYSRGDWLCKAKHESIAKVSVSCSPDKQ
ncbi:MAG TPA: hypothetical protein VGQ00_03110 [Candidatus Norongarragalinales archaeon]|jgi:hypothetical protein|nr:hypothetical protein [Candidatus Norongarragalinales archaeon]